MAEDLVLEWQNALRDAKTSDHPDVHDLLILEVATKLGAVDPYSGDPVMKKYHRSPRDTTPEQMLAILDGIQAQYQKNKIDPMTPIGAMAATSISEPIYQGGMRTFHYAGVLTKKDALQLLNIEVGNIPNKNALIALALPPEVRFNRSKVEEIALGLKRSVLGDYCHIVKNYPGYRHLVISRAVEKAEHDVRTFPVDERYTTIESYSELLGETVERTGPATPAFKKVLDEYQRVRQLFLEDAVAAGASDSYFIYLKQPEEMVRTEVTLTQDQLELIIRRQRVRGDGAIRTVADPDNPLHNIWRNAKVTKQTLMVGDVEVKGVVIDFPFLTNRLKMGFMETVLNLEFCNGCKSASTLAKLVHKAGRKGTQKVEDDAWDTDAPTTEYNATAVASLLEEAGVKQNPPLDDEELERLQDESVGLIEIDMSTSDRYDFEIAEIKQDRVCDQCGMGWYNIQTSVIPCNFGPAYEDYEETISGLQVDEGQYPEGSEGKIADYKFEKLNREIDILAHIGALKENTVLPNEVGFVSYPGVSRKGQNSDYPLAFMHGGRVINDPIVDEFYILINYKDQEDGRMNNFKGHFLSASKSDFVDFSRTTTSDTRQVEFVLGIEAARAQLAHNMFNAQGNGDTIAVAGNSSPVLFKHYLLLADTLTSGIKVTNARAGGASVSGAAAEKGRRTEEIDGELVSYGSVLAQAYERQTQVLLRAAPLGLIDDLVAPVSAQIAGQMQRSGTVGGATTGKYASVPTLDLMDRKAILADALKQVNDYSFEKIGRTWAGDENALSAFIAETGDDEFGIGALVREQANEMLADEDFTELLLRWKEAREDLNALLEQNGLA